MKKTRIHVVLHGGLGNQLFQYFTGCLAAKQHQSSNILLMPDLLAKYKTARGLELDPLIRAEVPTRAHAVPIDALSRARLPKLAWRLTGRELTPLVPGYGVIIDGYFQGSRSYSGQSLEHIKELVGEWRRALAAPLGLAAPVSANVTHIRLGDFFKSHDEARQFARARLLALHVSTDVVTDREEVVAGLLSALRLPFAVQVVPTATMSAWDLLALFCRYEHIRTNGSSLAFWAAVLANNQFESSNIDHMGIWRLLTGQAPSTT